MSGSWKKPEKRVAVFSNVKNKMVANWGTKKSKELVVIS